MPHRAARLELYAIFVYRPVVDCIPAPGRVNAVAVATVDRSLWRNAMQRLDFQKMRVGIDFGTTHTVAAIVDRGNYPVASFDGVDTWPSLVAANAAGELRFGLDAAAVRREAGWSVVRSFKHLLNNAGPRTEVTLGGRIHRLSDLLTGFLVQLKSDLVLRSNVELEPGERIEAAISAFR